MDGRSRVHLHSTIGFLVCAEIERARLETENLQLSDRLKTCKLFDRAKSVLQRDFQLNEVEAYGRMQRESRQRRKPMREISEAILFWPKISAAFPIEADAASFVQ